MLTIIRIPHNFNGSIHTLNATMFVLLNLNKREGILEGYSGSLTHQYTSQSPPLEVPMGGGGYSGPKF